METKKTFKRHLRKDVLLFFISIVVAIAIHKSGILEYILLLSAESEYLGALVAGMLFTSLFTTPLAITIFLSLAPEMNVLALVVTGALGALLGDLILFTLIRHTFTGDVEYLLNQRSYRRYTAVLHRRVFRWVIPFVGALIIASPLPDELGITLMGVSHMNASTLAAISFIMNSLAIASISLIA